MSAVEIGSLDDRPGSLCGQPAGKQSHRNQHKGHDDEGQRVGGFDLVEQTLEHARQRNGSDQTEREPHQRQTHSLSDHQPQHISSLRSERHADADLSPALSHQVGQYALKT